MKATDISRYADALQLLSEGHIFDPIGFARIVLAGASASAAWAADVAEMQRPRNADEQTEAVRAYRHSVARRKVVRAALAFDRACDEAPGDAPIVAWAHLREAVKAYRAAGGNEVLG